MHQPILAPLLVLAAWTMVVWLWMYVTRIPAIQRQNLKLDPNVPPRELMNQLPPAVRWKADNYNHLMEQPTVFYAVVLSLAVMGVGGGANLTLAWAYVGLRVVHTLVQVLWNKIEVRFTVFALSSLVLIALIVSALRGL
jgi:hypothetical protein